MASLSKADGWLVGPEFFDSSSYRQYGICSHCIALNHWLGEHDLGEICKDLGGGKKPKKCGYTKGVRPALIKETSGPKKTISKKSKPKQLKQK